MINDKLNITIPVVISRSQNVRLSILSFFSFSIEVSAPVDIGSALLKVMPSLPLGLLVTESGSVLRLGSHCQREDSNNLATRSSLATRGRELKTSY